MLAQTFGPPCTIYYSLHWFSLSKAIYSILCILLSYLFNYAETQWCPAFILLFFYSSFLFYFYCVCILFMSGPWKLLYTCRAKPVYQIHGTRTGITCHEPPIATTWDRYQGLHRQYSWACEQKKPPSQRSTHVPTKLQTLHISDSPSMLYFSPNWRYG